ncbi:hypothetical protein [Erythrobacter sp. SDW2]|nr:hypothetical protein [Erythrobacter sp. SDW2]
MSSVAQCPFGLSLSKASQNASLSPALRHAQRERVLVGEAAYG